MENEGMGAQGLSAVDKKITIALGEASSLPTRTHISNSLKLPRAFYRKLRNDKINLNLKFKYKLALKVNFFDKQID